MSAKTSNRLDSLRAIRSATRHTLWNRAGKWYVQFTDPASGRQHRISTGTGVREEAEAFLARHQALQLSDERLGIIWMQLWKRMERARARAKKKGVAFDIGREDLRALVSRSGGFCEVTGHPFSDKGPFQPSLDRINPSAGYRADNLRLVCHLTNTGMLGFGEEAFAQLALAYCKKRGLIP